jgi:hypothetical protein
MAQIVKTLVVTSGGGGGGSKNSQMIGNMIALFEKYLPATMPASATQFGRHLQLQTDHLLSLAITVFCVFLSARMRSARLPTSSINL